MRSSRSVAAEVKDALSRRGCLQQERENEIGATLRFCNVFVRKC